MDSLIQKGEEWGADGSPWSVGMLQPSRAVGNRCPAMTVGNVPVVGLGSAACEWLPSLVFSLALGLPQNSLRL